MEKFNIINNKYFGPKLNGINLQEAGNLFMENIIYFHNFVLWILFIIVILVSWFLVRTLFIFGNPILAFHIGLKYFYFKFLFFKIVDIFFYFGYIISKYIDRILLFLINQILNFIQWVKNYRLGKKGKLKIIGKFPTIRLSLDLYSQFIYLRPSINYFFFILDVLKFKKIDNFNDWIVINDFGYRYYFYSDVLVEFLWTIFPAIVLGILAIPSFSLLFSIQKFAAPEITVIVIGHQWYWEYQFMDFIKYNKVINIKNTSYNLNITNKKNDNYIIESYMIQDDDLKLGQLRLLEVDNKLVLPINTSIRLLITSDDVLHSWAVPSLGIKVDACPGRINELVINIRNIGSYYGQCSELCGWYHGFMPIAIQTLKKDDFKYYIMSNFLTFNYIKKK
jgi:heme/copper-type cytochrome/quinol oxidase subunit 2